jgi:hypothetical protein
MEYIVLGKGKGFKHSSYRTWDIWDGQWSYIHGLEMDGFYRSGV